MIQPDERSVAEAISRLAYCNPFLGERIELERRILGDEFTSFYAVWHPRDDVEDDNPNVLKIAERATALAEDLRSRLGKCEKPDKDEIALYQDVCLYVLYYRYHLRFFEMITKQTDPEAKRSTPFFTDFRKDFERLLGMAKVRLPESQTAEHVFACVFQLRRAFHYTFRAIAGGSLPAARLRSEVWQSVFTHDLRLFQRVLFERMGEVTTLITGPSGAGKELVARAIGHSRYIPFDARSRSFRESFDESFYPLNLPALSPTLIESELFGHRRGSFTGAVADRKGWLELCPPLGTVFLDEIGEVDPTIQVKLLRVLETRTFQQLGSSDELRFHGKVLAATNRDLDTEMAAGRFRQDLYYRLCADRIEAPSLRARIADSPDELATLVRFLVQRLVGSEPGDLTRSTVDWINSNLGPDYAWPGNVRELSQCVSNFIIHRNYQPVARARSGSVRERLSQDFLGAGLTADEMLSRYCTLVYARTGSYLAAAKALGLDRRTVKARVDEGLLAELD